MSIPLSSAEKGTIFLTTQRILDKDLCRTAEIEILRHLARRGYDVHLLATHSRNRYQGEEANFPVWSVPLREAPLIRPFFFALILFLLLPIYALLKKPRFIIATPGALTIPHVVWKPILSRCLRTKIILDIRSTPVEAKGQRGNLQVLVFDISVLLAKKVFDGMTIVTELMREEICRNFGLDPAVVGVWTNGVSLELFDSATHENEAFRLRKELGLAEKTVVLYHGVFSPDRGLVESVKGMANLKDEGIVLFLLGNGPALPAIEEAIRQNDLQEHVIVHKSVKYTDVPKYIAMSDAGLIPLPNTPNWVHQNALNLLECIAMGKPVIVTDIPANRSVLGENKCAIYLPSATPTEFSYAMAYLHGNYEKLKEWGSCGETLVRHKYSWAAVAERLENYLRTR